MRTSVRRTKPTVRLNCEALEDRLTPAVAYALSGANLLAFDTAAPATVTTTALNLTPVTAAGETLVGIDFRPQNGELYALGVNATTDTATLYTVSARTGVVTTIGTPGQISFQDAAGVAVDLPAPSATLGYGFDFNPSVDRIRVVAGSLNFRVNPNTGAAVDGDLGGAIAVPNRNTDAPINAAAAGGTTTLDASAYSNNSANVTTTVLFGLDATTDALYTQAANAGTTTTVGALGINFDFANGFDISASGTAFAALTVGGVTGLYTINTTTGAATRVATIGAGAAVQGLAVQSDANGTPAVALSADGASIVRFNTATPGTATTAALPAPGTAGGVATNEVLVGLDYRPNTGQLFALAVNTTANTLQLYLVTPQTVTAGVDTASVTAVGGPIAATAFPAGTTFPAGGYGFDFNPTASAGLGLIRVTTSTGLNFRIQPNDGTLAGVDTPISGSGVTGVTGTAYTNSFGQAAGGATTQYTLDDVGNSLLIQGAVAPPGPNGGVQSARLPVTVGGAALDFTAVSGFDIPAGVRVGASGTPAAGSGFAALTVGGITSIYQIDLATGAATNLGAAPVALSGLSVADTTGGVVSFQSAAASGVEGGAINVVLTRTGGTGPQTVTVNVTGGTATPGTDFPGGPYTVTFADGATTATLTIPFVNDGVNEGPETVTLAIAAVSNGLIGSQSTTTLTVTGAAQRYNQVFGTASGAPLVGFASSGSNTVTTITPYAGTNLSGGVRVAAGDINGDGIDDLVTINAIGAPLVKVFSGATGSQITSFMAYPSAIAIPAALAVGDTNNDGFDDIIISTTNTIGAVIVFSGKDFSQIGLFLPFGTLPVGFNVAAGDTNNDGSDDIILGTATGLSAVAIFSGKDFSQMGVFLPFGSFALGTTVAAGDLDGDGKLDIVVGTNSTIPAVAVFNGKSPLVQSTVFFPFGLSTGGANVSVSDVNGDGLPDIVTGQTSGAAVTRALDGRTLSQLNTITPFGNFPGGVFVG